MENIDIKYRYTVKVEDITSVREITKSTGFFREDEIEIAVELVQEAYEKGQQESGYNFIFIEKSGEVIGFSCYGHIGCTILRYDLYWIVISRDYRANGFGSELLKETERRVGMEQGKKIYIETSSDEKYESTRYFYLKNEYRKVARLRDFYDDGDDKIIYEKDIQELL